jgi:hypothetical protein
LTYLSITIYSYSYKTISYQRVVLKCQWNIVTHYGSVQPHNGGVPSGDRTVQWCKIRARDWLLCCFCLKEDCTRV